MRFKTFLLIIGILLLCTSLQLVIVKDYLSSVLFLAGGCFAIWSRDNVEDV